MMLAFSSAHASTVRAASSTSVNVRSGPPAMENSTREAPAMDASSRLEFVACCAASSARFSPLAMPMPIMAVPASFLTVRMSAKSRLMRPGMVMRSVTPWMPWRNVSSAMRKASIIEVFLSTISSRRSFGMTMSVSTFWESRSMPCSAWLRRTRPSNENGFVTMPMVSAPISSRAISAMMGAAPVPVPPPSPAVTKTMSASASASRISVRLSSAA